MYQIREQMRNDEKRAERRTQGWSELAGRDKENASQQHGREVFLPSAKCSIPASVRKLQVLIRPSSRTEKDLDEMRMGVTSR